MNEQIKLWLLLGREHFSKREFDKAEQLFRQVLAAEDRFADVHDTLGLISHERGNLVAAERHFRRALELNPNYTEASLNLSVILNERGKYEEARDISAKIKGRPGGTIEALDPFARGKLANMHADIAQAYADSSLFREACEEMRRAVSLCPQFADLRTRLGAWLRQIGDLSGARRELEAAIAARPAYVPARVQLGITLFSIGENAAAEKEWKHALSLEPDQAQAKMYLRIVADKRT
ncbi:MAG: tetratricopeptide repeat protein [Polyangiaceae bacterium]|nr:tetratricopeptide repeat protein [Polyangiaceae bacterium]